MNLLKLLFFVVASLIIGSVFWILAGHNLGYEVGSTVNGDYVFSHTERLSFFGRIVITGLVSVASSAFILFMGHMIIGYFRPISVSIRVFKTEK